MTKLAANFKSKGSYVGFFILLTILFNASELLAENITLSWTPPAKNADGTPIQDLSGYKIYYGTTSGDYTNSLDVGNATTGYIDNLSENITYYFAVTAYNSLGDQSDYSNEISVTIGISDNNSPSTPELVFPENNLINVDSSSVEFRWKRSVDPDGDLVIYDLRLCEDESFTVGCISSMNIIAQNYNAIAYADAGFSSGILLMAIITGLIGILSYRKKISWIILFSALTVILISSCGGGGGSGDNSTKGSPTSINTNSSEVSFTVSGLKHRTVYFWEVIAKDDNGSEISSGTWSFDTL